MSSEFNEKDPIATPKVDDVNDRLTEAEIRVERLEKRVEVLERGKTHEFVRS